MVSAKERLSEHEKDILCRCKDSLEVNISTRGIHVSKDPSKWGRSTTVRFGQYSNSICGVDLAGAIGGASVGSPSPSKYRRTDAGSVMKAMIFIFP